MSNVDVVMLGVLLFSLIFYIMFRKKLQSEVQNDR